MLDVFIERYTNDRVERASTSRKTANEQRLTLLQFSRTFGRRQVAKMGEADIVRWLGTTADLKPATRRNKLSIVKGFCRWMVKQGYIRRDPTVDVRSPRQPRTVPKVFEGDAVARLLDGCPDARARLIVLLMCQMGLRCGEVAGLELGDIDGRLALVEGKGGHQRAVPLVAEVRSALDAYLFERGGHAGPLISNYRRPGHGLAHGLRRTCASA